MLSRPFTRFVARLRAAVGSDAAGLRQALAALLVSSGGDLLAGLTLGAITGTLEALPGLLVLVPAAIGMRGNIFGALGSRLGTSIHTGTFSLSRRRDTVVGQNVVASIALTLFVSAALAVLAKAVAGIFGVTETISLADFLVISIIGGVLSSIVVLASPSAWPPCRSREGGTWTTAPPPLSPRPATWSRWRRCSWPRTWSASRGSPSRSRWWPAPSRSARWCGPSG